MKKIIIPIVIVSSLIILVGCYSKNEQHKKGDIMMNTEIEKKIDSLLEKMTVEEKVGQMNQYNGFWDVTGPAT